MSNVILKSVSQGSNETYVVWDVVPRNVLVDADGDMYVVDAKIKKLYGSTEINI